jgi:hypothetical protein
MKTKLLDGEYYYRSKGKWHHCSVWPENPAPGIWLVTDGARTLFMRLGDTPTVEVAATFAMRRDVIAASIVEQRAKDPYCSANEMAEAIIRAVSDVESKERI